MRKARSVAWFSTAGFHQRSKWKTWFAAVRFRPVPPALSDSTKRRRTPSPRVWKRSTMRSRLAAGTPPWRNSTSPPKVSGKVRLEALAHLGELGEDQGAVALGEQLLEHLVRRASLPERPGSGESSPRNCAGWLQTCLSLVSVARMTPLRWMPSAAPRARAQSLRRRPRRACLLRVRVQYTFISIFSGRSAMTVLSVLRRRRMNGAVSRWSCAAASASRCALNRDEEAPPEFGLCAEKAGVEEVHDRPELADVVLDRRAGQGDAVTGRSASARPALARVSGS